MVQLKRKVKLKQKTESPKPRPYFSKKVITGITAACILAVGGGTYAIYKNLERDDITVTYNTDGSKESPMGGNSYDDTIDEMDDTTKTSEKQDVLQQSSTNNEQSAPNSKQEVNPPPTNIQMVHSELEQEALSVIRGNYGNNPVRRRKLGDRYQEIQDRVNQMYREGKVR